MSDPRATTLSVFVTCRSRWVPQAKLPQGTKNRVQSNPYPSPYQANGDISISNEATLARTARMGPCPAATPSTDNLSKAFTVCRASKSCISFEAPGASSVPSFPRSSTREVSRSRSSGNCCSISAARDDSETGAIAGRTTPRHINPIATTNHPASKHSRTVLFNAKRPSSSRPQPRNRQTPRRVRATPRTKAASRICLSSASNCCSISGGMPARTTDMTISQSNR